jgi:hypothetical protein
MIEVGRMLSAWMKKRKEEKEKMAKLGIEEPIKPKKQKKKAEDLVKEKESQ